MTPEEKKASNLFLSQAAGLMGTARKTGMTDDEALASAELQRQRSEIQKEISLQKQQGLKPDQTLLNRLSLIQQEQRQLNIELARRQQRERRGRNDNRRANTESLSGEQLAALQALGIDPDNYKVGENADNAQQFPGEKGGKDRSRSFMQQVAQNWDDGEDPNRFQNFGGVVGLQDGNRAQVGSEDYYNEMMAGDNERGLTPFDVARGRKQGPIIDPPRGAVRGANGEVLLSARTGARPESLDEYLNSLYNVDTVASPDGRRGSPAHMSLIAENQQSRARGVINNLYSEDFLSTWFLNRNTFEDLVTATRELEATGNSDAINRVESQLRTDLNGPELDSSISRANSNRLNYLGDLVGEDWKNQDFGDGREMPAGLQRRMIGGSFKAPDQMVAKELAVRDKDKNTIKVQGKDGKVRSIYIRHQPGKVFGEDVFGIDEEGNRYGRNDLLRVIDRDGGIAEPRVMEVLRGTGGESELIQSAPRPLQKVINGGRAPKPREQFFRSIQQQPGNSTGAIQNAIIELESALADPNNPLKGSDQIRPELFSDPAIQQNLKNLYGTQNASDVVISSTNPQERAQLQERRRLNPGVIDPVLGVTQRTPPTVDELLLNLKGSVDGGVLLERDRREARKAREVADRRASGVFTEDEIRAAAARGANAAIAGPGKDDWGANARGLVALEREARTDKQLSSSLQDIENQLSQIDASTPDGKVEQARLIKRYREIAIGQRQGKMGRGPGGVQGTNEEFSPEFLRQVDLGREQKKPDMREFESFEEALAKGIAKEPAWDSGLSPEEARAQRAYIENAQLEAVRLNAADAQARGEVVRPIRQAANQAAAEVWPVRLAEAAVLREKAQRGGMINDDQFDAVLRGLNTEILPTQNINSINGAVGQGYLRGVDGRGFEAVIQASDLANRGTAVPIIENGVIIGYRGLKTPSTEDSISTWGVDSPNSSYVIGDENFESQLVRRPRTLNALGQVVEKWDEPVDPSIGRAKAWIDSAVYDQYDERRVGEAPDLDWKGLQVGESMKLLDEAVARKLQLPNGSVAIRNIEDFQNNINAVINNQDVFDMRDVPEGIPFNQAPGGNKRVRKADLPETLLFDAAMQDMKINGVDRKNVARAMDVLAKGMANVGPDGQRINAAQKDQWNAGRPNLIGQLSGSQQQQVDMINSQAIPELEPGSDADRKVRERRVADAARGVQKLERDADWNEVGGAKVGMMKRDRNGRVIEEVIQTPGGMVKRPKAVQQPIKGMLRDLDVNQEVDRQVDLKVAEVENELRSLLANGDEGVRQALGNRSARVTPSERRAIRDRLFAEIVGPDIDQWQPAAQQPFIGAIGEGNKGGTPRVQGADRQNVVQVNINDTPDQIIEGLQFFPDGKPRNNASEMADQRIAARYLELQRQLQGPAPATPVSPEQIRRSNQRGAAELAAIEAKTRRPLKPADIINLERKDRARQRGEEAPATFIPRGLDGGRNMQMGDPWGMERGVFPGNAGVTGRVGPVRNERAFNPGLIMDAAGTQPDPWANGAVIPTARSNAATSAITSPTGQGASVIDQRDVEKAVSQVRQTRDQALADPWIGTSSPAIQGQEPIGQAPGVSSQRADADKGISAESSKRKKAPKDEASNVRPTERRFGDRVRGAANQVKAFATKPQYSQGRRIGYGVGGGVLGAMGLDALIGGEREKREEQAVR